MNSLSGRSCVGRTRNVVAPTTLASQFEQPYRPMGPPTLSTIPVLRYMKTYGLTHEQLAMVSVVQRQWAAKNPRATFKTPITVVIVSLGLVRFRRAAAPIEAKIAASGPCNCHTRIISYWIDSCELVQDSL
jgi:hypothetical protein